MFEIKNFDNWVEDDFSGKFGSGASEKKWLINPDTGEKGVFKFPKVRIDKKITGEFWTEKLASEIGKIIGIKCANVDMGKYHGRIGSMSYNIINKDVQSFIEGIEFIQRAYPYYDKDKLKDVHSDNVYSVQMIKNSIDSLVNINEFYKIIIFDALIGNSDRHHSNWGIISIKKIDKNNKFLNFCMSPLYDNGSSLCAYEYNNDIEIFFKDKMKFEALINTKSKSAIGWKNKRPIRHFELIEKLKQNAYNSTIEFILQIKERINEENIDRILSDFDDNIIDEKMKKLLKKYLLERRLRILNIYDLKDGD